ncbi:MAG: uroporphyrinogen-III C-methyltransferase [Oscillospiraceae bacterium]|jgi:uroporphyrinogen III methyltransferase / synthase
MPEQHGKVWLVGAGPSDPGLMTLRGYELLQTADVVVYDRLVGYSIPAMIPDSAEKIYVGKCSGRHPIPQHEINQILVREALAGKRVVRLKGGDPFLFGRGGEEIAELRRHHIPYEVVSGVPSAIAVPAYAGIPVTHRSGGNSLHIFTGHHAAGKNAKLDFSILSKLNGTLVFLMSVASAEFICKGLLEAGMAQDTPAAVIENGTTARQRTVSATLNTLAEQIVTQKIHSPAILVIGENASFAGQFSWVQNNPLYGKRIIVTRPRTHCMDFCRKIRALGGEAVVVPCIQTVPCHQNKMAAVMERLSHFTWVTFSSATGVNLFFQALHKAGKDSRALSQIKVAAIGSATAKALKKHGIFADLIPNKFDSLHFSQALNKVMDSKDCVLVIRPLEGSSQLEEQFLRKDIPFEAVSCYKTELVQNDENSFPEIRKIIEDGNFDLITFTSASTVKGFVQLFPNLDFSHCTAVCIGPETAAEANKYGFHTIVARVSTMDGMLETMTQ